MSKQCDQEDSLEKDILVKIRFSQFTELDNWVITDGEGEIGRGFEDFGN